MSRRRKKEGDEEVAPRGPGLIVRTFRFFETVLILLIIAYAAVHLISRTDGFRSLLAERLQKITGMPLRIEKSRARWNLDIELTQLGTESNGQKGQPRIAARRAMLMWSPMASLLRREFVMDGAEVDGGEIDFATSVSGQWEPAPLAPLSDRVAKWIGMDFQKHVKIDAAPAPGDKQATEAADGPSASMSNSSLLRIKNLNVSWWTSATNEIARLDGLSLSVTPLKTPGRPLTHYLLQLDDASTSAGFHVKNVNIELLDAKDQQVVLAFQADNESPARGRPSGR